MTIQPYSGGNQGTPAVGTQSWQGFSAGANAQTAPDETRADAVLQAKISLDGREEGYRGIVSAPEAAASQVSTGATLDASHQAPDWADKPLSELTDEQLHQLFGDQDKKMRELGQLRPGVTGTQALPLKKDVADLESITALLSSRPDLNWGDLVKVGADGKTRVDPSATDGTSRELLGARQDIKPLELTQMAAGFNAELREPGLAEAARKKALVLLRERPDVKPHELTGLMQTLVRGQDGNAGQSPAAALDMFDSCARLLTTRRDLGVQDADRLASSVLGMSGKKDSKSGLRSATSMAEAVDTLAVRQDMGVVGIIDLTQTMGKRFPGQDEGSAADRHAGFSKGLSLMRQVPGMDASTIGTMMEKASEGPPPRKGIKLLQAFDTMSQGVLSGRANMELMRDPLAKADPSGRRKRDGEIALDRYGVEKGAASEGPRLEAHQAPHGSQTEPERPVGGQQPGTPDNAGPNPDSKGAPGPEAASDPGTPEPDPRDRRQQG